MKPSHKWLKVRSLEAVSWSRFIIHDDAMANDIPTLDFKKDLGVWITSSLSFTHHHAPAAKKGFTVLNMIKRTFLRNNRDDFRQLFVTWTRPLLENVNSVVPLKTANGYKLFRESTTRSYSICQWSAKVSLWGKVATPRPLSSWHSSSARRLDSYVSFLHRKSSP